MTGLSLKSSFTSDGSKFFHHREAMEGLRDGRPRPITAHVMLTDLCQHSCAFCSVHHREGNSLTWMQITGFVSTLLQHGLKSVILSGGGNPILYRCKETGKNFNDVVDWLHANGLEVGCISNGMPLRRFETRGNVPFVRATFRESWATVHPNTLDKLTWLRVSMAGLDHEEKEVFVPDIDPAKTTLGFSYVLHDIYRTKADKKHGAVSTKADLFRLNTDPDSVERWVDRLPWLTEQFKTYCKAFKPAYLRLLPNCLEPGEIAARCLTLGAVAQEVNEMCGREVAFVQHKPPAAPKSCHLGYVHPVLNTDGWVYPCDSCVLNDAAGHKFANPWRVCRWDEVGKLYEEGPVKSLIADPAKTCPGCVFHQTNNLLDDVRHGRCEITPPEAVPSHPNFI